MNQTTIDTGRFDIARIAATLPETATTLLVDHYLTNRETASARVFRVYKLTKYLLVPGGRVLNPQSYHSAFRISSTRYKEAQENRESPSQ